eukprot:Filipodium_phascolosomae@DN6614_c0_g1_i1.p1
MEAPPPLRKDAIMSISPPERDRSATEEEMQDQTGSERIDQNRQQTGQIGQKFTIHQLLQLRPQVSENDDPPESLRTLKLTTNEKGGLTDRTPRGGERNYRRNFSG